MFNRILKSGWFTAIISIVLGFLLLSLIKIRPAILTARDELKNLENKIAEVNKSISESERLAEYLISDNYFERQARLKLNYKKPDEKVVYIYKGAEGNTRSNDFSADKKISKEGEANDDKVVSSWKLWLRYLVGK